VGRSRRTEPFSLAPPPDRQPASADDQAALRHSLKPTCEITIAAPKEYLRLRAP
jgi:hypothetical protein